MATKKKNTTQNIKLIRGVRIHGKSYFPKTKSGKGEVDTIITVTEALAAQLVASGKAAVTNDKATVTVEVPKDDLESELDAALGE